MRSTQICIWSTKPDRAKLDRSEPDMWSQTKAFTDVLGQPIGPSFQSQENQKREHGTTEVNWHNLLFWDSVYHLIPKRHNVSEDGSVSFSGKEAPNLVDPLE